MSDDQNVQAPAVEPTTIASDTESQTPIASEEVAANVDAGSLPEESPQGGQVNEWEQKYTKLEKDFKSVGGKVSKLEKEANEAKQYKQQLDTLTTWIKSDEVAYKRALVASGYSESQAEEQLKSLKAQNGQVAQQTPTYQQQADPRAVYYQIRGQEKFFDAIPEMNPKNIKIEDREDKAELASRVEMLGNALLQTGKASDYGDSLIEAYKIITGGSQKVIESAREEGKLEGMAEANLLKGSVISPTQGGQTPKATVNLTDAERQIARAMGLSDQQYAEGKLL